MAFLFGRIVGINAGSLYMNLSTRHSMSGLVGLRVFCVRICWNVLRPRAIRMDRWSRKLLQQQRNCAPNKSRTVGESAGRMAAIKGVSGTRSAGRAPPDAQLSAPALHLPTLKATG